MATKRQARPGLYQPPGFCQAPVITGRRAGYANRQPASHDHAELRRAIMPVLYADTLDTVSPRRRL
jgi:hypothetical protein